MTTNCINENEQIFIGKTAEFVKNKLCGEATGHDWWHAYRVWQNAKHILKSEESADVLTVELAALLHDISDWKFNNGDDSVGPKIAKDFLMSISVDEKTAQHVSDIIATLSFKGANVKTPMKTIEGEIVQDSDRLDAIGAIGIARSFAYGAFAEQEMYNPEIKPNLHSSYEEYKNAKGTTVNHFYEKLLLLSERMNTQSAKNIAQKRHEFMQNYLEEFFNEWNGKS
ncbi:MAG: HD domain-containing protein [Candidatus Gastranaerophilales bacterium]|nr:HD domain-containing protein [Candidatus Gastranaerophilales bacterium]